MKTIRENLLLQFAVIAAVILGVVLFFTSWWMKDAMEHFILERAATEVVDTVSRLLTNQLVPEDFQKPMVGERYDAFNDYMQRYIVSDRIARIKLWSPQGQVIFSTDRSQVGRSFLIKEALARALQGGLGRDISIPQAAENERERLLGTLIEVYAPIRAPLSGEVVGAFETYEYFAPIAHHINHHNRQLYIIMTVGGGALYLALFLIVLSGWRTILRQRRDLTSAYRTLEIDHNLALRLIEEREREIEDLRKRLEQRTQNGPGM